MYAFAHILNFYRHQLRANPANDATWSSVDWYAHAVITYRYN